MVQLRGDGFEIANTRNTLNCCFVYLNGFIVSNLKLTAGCRIFLESYKLINEGCALNLDCISVACTHNKIK